MSEAPLLLPREVAVIAVGLAALVIGLLAGHGTPTFSHAPTVEKAELEAAKNVHELLPDSFRIEATVKKTGLTLLQSEDILLLGGDRSDAACSGGAFFLFWEDGAFGMGCQCNGPSAAGCPGTSAACSDPSIRGPSKFEPNVEYTVVAEYSRKSQVANLLVDGELYLSKHVHWMPPVRPYPPLFPRVYQLRSHDATLTGLQQPQRSGPVTLLAGSHSSADTEPFLGEARNIGVWPLPAGSWGWDMIGVVMGLVGVVCLPSFTTSHACHCAPSGVLATRATAHAAIWIVCSILAWAQRSAAAHTSAPAPCLSVTRTPLSGRRCQAWSPTALTGHAEVDKAWASARGGILR